MNTKWTTPSTAKIYAQTSCHTIADDGFVRRRFSDGQRDPYQQPPAPGNGECTTPKLLLSLSLSLSLTLYWNGRCHTVEAEGAENKYLPYLQREAGTTSDPIESWGSGTLNIKEWNLEQLVMQPNRNFLRPRWPMHQVLTYCPRHLQRPTAQDSKSAEALR